MTQTFSTDHAATLRMWEVAMNSITEMVSVLGEDEVYRVVNDAWCRTMQRRREDAIGRTATELFNLTAPTERLRAVHDCLREHRPQVVRGPSQLPHLAGRVFEATYTPHGLSDSGVRCVVVVTRDITVETEALRRIQDNETETRSLFEAFPGLIGVLDHRLHYTFVNDPMVALLQRPRESIVGHGVDTVLGTDRGREVLQLAAQARQNGTAVFERQVGARHLQVTLTALIDSRTGLPRYHGFGIDITGLKQAEQALIAARDEAERANRAKSQFLSHMSHELRTPLNAILGFAQVFDTDAALSPTQHAQTGEILLGARHLLTLINDVLDLGSIEAGRLALEIAPLSLAEVVHECVNLVEPLARGRQVQLEAPDERCLAHQVDGDRLRLKQVLLNLLANAIKYNRVGGSVSLRCTARRKALRLVVVDTGPGLDAAQQARLFAAFERVHEDHAGVEGTGIGLALSKRLMQAMGGDIGVVSAPGAGSRFWIELPLLTRRPSVDLPHEVPDTNTLALTGAGPRTVLYIEDNPVNIVLMEAMLMRLPGVTMISETMPLPGIARALEAPPDLILLDIQLPGLSGFDVLARLRAMPATRRIPVIAVSANAMPADVDAGRAAGFFDYLTKPLELATLLATVEAALLALA